MNQKKWILSAAAVLGLLLVVIAGIFVKHELGKNNSGAAHKTVQESGQEPEGLAAPGEMEAVADGTEQESGSGQIKEDTAEAGSDISAPEISAGDSAPDDRAPDDQITDAKTTDIQEDSDAKDTPIRLTFAGDILLSDHVLEAYRRGGGIRGVLDDSLQSVIDDGDFFIANEEFPFSTRGTAAADKQFTFRVPPEKVSMFHELGIDLVSLANNHALDFGTDALLDTCETLDKAGIYRVGAGKNLDEAKKPVIVELKGKKIGFLGASRVIPEGSWGAGASKPGMLITYDPAILLEEIKKTREECDYLVVYVHWGIERHECPEEYQRTLGKQYIDAGADLVIGSHPHVLQGLEYYKGKPIVYSLGNFIFGSSIPKSMLLTVDWDGEESRLRLVPATSSAGYTRAVTGEKEQEAFYRYITDLSYDVTVEQDGSVSAQ